MHVLIVSSEFPPGPGGIGTHAYQIASTLQSVGCCVDVITPQDYVPASDAVSFNKDLPFSVERLDHFPSPILEAIFRAKVINDRVARINPDVILATGERSVWIMNFLSPVIRKPWIAVGHGTEFKLGASLEKQLTRTSFNRADGIICVSQYTQQIMLDLGVKPKTCVVIPNGADDNQFTPGIIPQSKDWLGTYGIPENAFVLLTVGHVTDRKGQEVVIRSLPGVLEQVPSVHYLMAGLPTNQTKLCQLAFDLKVQNNIHFSGKVGMEDLVKMYQAFDVFIMTSRHTTSGDFEGFGIAVIEAALCGKPAIVSRGSGLQEAVVNGVTGITVPENDPFETAKAIIRMARRPDLRINMGLSAQQRAKSELTWQIIGKKYYSFLQQIVGTVV